MSVCLSVRPSVYPPSVYLSICLSIYPSIYISKSRYRTNKEVEIAATCCNQLESHSNNRTHQGPNHRVDLFKSIARPPWWSAQAARFRCRPSDDCFAVAVYCCLMLKLFIYSLMTIPRLSSPPKKKVPHVQRDSFRLGFPTHFRPLAASSGWDGAWMLKPETSNAENWLSDMVNVLKFITQLLGT